MTAAVESSLSSSLRRMSLAPADDSEAISLPSIDFGFKALRDRMAQFTDKFDKFLHKRREDVLLKCNEHSKLLAGLEDEKQNLKREIRRIKSEIALQCDIIDKEEAERQDLEASIESLEAQRDAHLAKRQRLQTQIAKTEAEIANRLEAQARYAAERDAQSRFNVPELDFWVTVLCLRIEGAGHPERLKFVYTHIDERDWYREAWFELDTTSRDYDIRQSKPKLERDKIDKVLERVNESRELVVLLRGMRELFIEAMR